MILIFTYLIFISYLVQFISTHHQCNHIPLLPHQINHVHLEPKRVIMKRNADQPLRIKVFYDKSIEKIPKEKFAIINNTILPQALNYWEKALFVKPHNVPIRLNRKCPNNQAFFPENDGYQYCIAKCENVTTCGEVVVPQNHLEQCRYCDLNGRSCRVDKFSDKGEGIENADFIFYVSAMQTERCNKGHTVAYAAHCQQESSLDRPIAGHANLCPDSISTKPQDLDTLLSTVKHEILHALGFSVSLYAYFRDKEGNPLTPRESNGKPLISRHLKVPQWSERVIKSITRKDWQVRGKTIDRNINVMVTPRVVEEVRKHFNCSILEGAELEDQGEDGTLLTHWEKRVFENEAMTGTHTQNPIYSRITLALMEDTGWYLPNYDMAQTLEWGRNLGCDFAMKSCKEWIDNRRERGESIHPYCDKVKRDPLETECTDKRDAVALCNLMEYPNNLPDVYQNFDRIPGVKNSADTSRYGGSVNLADYCPYIQEFTWKFQDVVVRGSQCQFEENNPLPEKNFALEYYGSNSKCFNHNNEMWEERSCSQVRQWQHWGSGCYKYKCENGLLHLIISNYTFTCYYSGQEIKIQLYANDWLHKGTIICPPCNQICQKCRVDLDINDIETFEIKSYHKHFLKCDSFGMKKPTLSVIICISILIYYFS